jgi:uncharacterized protein YbbC (DUF1343 family)
MKIISQRLLFGIDNFLQQANKFSNLHLALVTNNAASTSKGILSRIALIKENFKLTKLFSPEHGITAQGEDGAFQVNITDTITGLPVISLYGDRLKLSKEDMADIDAVLFDIPDVGCRFYTYLWTMTYMMEACAEFNKPLFILDRPNPVGGDFNLVEGPMLDETNCASFIGRWSIPVRHSCTLGELATYFASSRVKNLNLQIIKVRNWRREQSAKEANWLFIPPSPAIRDEETALLYPGMGLLEGINVNEGRSTESPFKIFGAPWINASQIQKAFESLQLPGIISQPHSYKPSFGIYIDEYCQGLRLGVTNVFTFRPVQTVLKLIQLLTSLYPEYCMERLYKTRANPGGEKHLDKLTGIYNSFEKIKQGEMPDQGLIKTEWKETMRPYLFY